MARELPPGRAELVRACARDPVVRALVPEQADWDVPHRILAAIEYLVLAGEAEYGDPQEFCAVVRDRVAWVEEFVRDRSIQTNEPQRSWALLPFFLTIARFADKPLDLVELGPSAGLNLVWDRYRYRYVGGNWGPADSPLELDGEERRSVPGDLFGVEVAVGRRLGIDLSPVDATTADGLRLLQCFTVDAQRRERIRRAAEVVRRTPPELVRGDYVDVLPSVLADRDEAALTVVFQTISTIYLPLERRLRLRAVIDRAGREAPLAWLSTPTPEEHGLRGRQYPIELALWPGGERRLVGEMSNSADWLEWWG
jgi:hypothetical protein